MSQHTIAVIGGTGPQGRGLAYRFARAGHDVVIGSRSAEKASATAGELAAMPRIAGAMTGASNQAAASGADVVLVAVPYDGYAALLKHLSDALAGKILVSCVNPLGFDKRGATARTSHTAVPPRKPLRCYRRPASLPPSTMSRRATSSIPRAT